MRRIILVGLAMLAACGPARTVTDTDVGRDVVPWIDRPYAAASPSPLPEGVEACSAADLEIGGFGDAGPAAGTIYAEAEVRNVSSTPCALTPKATVRYLDDDAVVESSPLETYGEAVFVPIESEVASAGAKRVRLRIAIPNVCPPPAATSVTVSLFPGEETLDLPPGSGSASPAPGDCGEEGHYTLSVEAPDADPESPLDALEAAIRTEGVVVPGIAFRYFVRLFNPTDRAIALDPCPGYSEGLKAPHGGQATYVLNCSEVRSIPPEQAVVYEMYLEVPEEFGPETNPERRALLTWSILGGGPSASAEVQVAG